MFESLRALVEYLASEGAVIAEAPVAFAVITLLIIGVTWVLMRRIHAHQIENLRSGRESLGLVWH